MAKNKVLKKLARRLFYLKMNKPALYYFLSAITDGMIFGTWLIFSAVIALYLVKKGYDYITVMTFFCMITINVTILLCNTDDYLESDR